MKQKKKRSIFRNVFRYSRSKFVRKYVSRKRNGKSWLLKKNRFLMPPQIQKYYQNEYRLNSIFSSDNLPNKIKDGTCRC